MSAKKRRAEGPAVTRRSKQPRTPRQRLVSFLKALFIFGVVAALLATGVFVVLYKAIEIPEPNSAFQAQTTFVYYEDGKTELGTYYEDQNRESIPYSEMPESIQDAVVAAENQTFWTDKGIDPVGILRAAFQNARSGTDQGASTITQQYVKILYLSSERSYKRKVKEAIVSLKIQQQMSKEEVLEGYLNTIYFGRGAYGIQSAAQAYFDKDASKLNLRESAALATILNNPANYDPGNGQEARDRLRVRYENVLTQMAEMETITEERREKAARKLPKFPKIATSSAYGGQKGHMLALVKEELIGRGIATEQEIDGGGLRITTTFDRAVMKASEEGVVSQRSDKQSDKVLHMASASVEPGTGALRGFYAGQDYLESQINWAETGGMAGSTMKAFAVATALQEGFALSDTFDGNSPYELPDGTDLENQGNASYGQVSLTQATTSSINTAFVDLTLAMDDGPEKIIDTMNAAGIPPEDGSASGYGIPTSTPGLEPITGVALGNATVSPINMANAYATLADKGKRADVHVVQRVVDSNGEEIYTHNDASEQTIKADVVADTTYALQQVVSSGGTGSRATALGRPAIGKTGTATRSGGGVASSWFAGATPQLATVVMQVRGDGQGELDEVEPDGTYWVGDSFAGGYYPAMAWTAIMQQALEGEPVEEFPEPVYLDGDAPSDGHESEYEYTTPPSTPPAPQPTRKPSKSPTVGQPSKSPTETPTETPTESPTPTETPVPTTPPTPSPPPSPPPAPPTTPPAPPPATPTPTPAPTSDPRRA